MLKDKLTYQIIKEAKNNVVEILTHKYFNNYPDTLYIRSNPNRFNIDTEYRYTLVYNIVYDNTINIKDNILSKVIPSDNFLLDIKLHRKNTYINSIGNVMYDSYVEFICNQILKRFDLIFEKAMETRNGILLENSVHEAFNSLYSIT